MQKSSFNILVEKVMKKMGRRLSLSDIESLMSHSGPQTMTRAQMYKLVHTAKNKGILLSLKKDIYVVSDETTTPESILQQHYRPMLADHIKTYLGGHGLIT
jgi:hypothetical protein